MRWLVTCLLMFCAAEAVASSLFESHEVIQATLTGPLSTVLRSGDENGELPFTMTVEGQTYELHVRTRGNSRLQVCNFPPLRFNFTDDKADSGPFSGQGKLKLVTHCRNSDRAEQDMLEEYLVYRLFNVITDHSLRVRLLRFHYEDTDQRLKKGNTPRYGFVLESEDALAARIGADLAQLTGVPTKRHDLQLAALVYVFQYMVGNTDWGFVKAEYDDTCCHNVILLERDGRVLTVPYDFDLTGMVNARYAYPDPNFRIRSVRQRLYRGLCTDPSLLHAAIAAVLAKRDELIEVVRMTPGLVERNAKSGEQYLGKFFQQAADSDDLVKHFKSRCLE